MSWKISGQSMEMCNCKMLCPCWLGPEVEPDEGWCGGTIGFDIQTGNSDGVDLSGTVVALVAEWPGNFFDGNGSARLYLDESASAEQRAILEKIFSGNDGGPLEPLFGAVISKWLPSQVVQLNIDWGETPSLRVGDIGKGTLKRLKDATGQSTRVTGAAAQAGFQFEGMDLASSSGSHWSDPDLQDWDGNSGTLHEFNWSS